MENGGTIGGETNAAVDGAFRAGATEVVVRDSHGAKQNLLPGDVDPRARLLRGQSTGPKNMMEGIDKTFDAVVFIGYHARAGTPNAHFRSGQGACGQLPGARRSVRTVLPRDDGLGRARHI